MRHPEPRIRATVAVAAGALLLSGTLATACRDFTSHWLVNAQEHISLPAARFDADVTATGLAGDDPDITGILRSLDTGADRHAVLHRGERWYTGDSDAEEFASIPSSLQAFVASGRVGFQRVRTRHGSALVTGIPLPSGTEFYEIDSLSELRNTLHLLTWILILLAAHTTVLGGIGGWRGSSAAHGDRDGASWARPDGGSPPTSTAVRRQRSSRSDDARR